MAMVCTSMSTVPGMKGNGKMIFSMEMDLKNGQMAVLMKEPIQVERSMAMEFIYGMMDRSMKANGQKTK